MRRTVGPALVLAGVLLAAWTLVGPTLAARDTARAQADLADELPTSVAGSGGPGVPMARAVARGQALATIRVPRFGADWSWVAVEGTGDAELRLGPGHYEGTPLPGSVGNVAFAAHRAGHGDPFLDFDRLRPGDVVAVEQGGVQWVYRLDTRPRIIDPEDTWVLDPLPGRRITLTTCWPRYGSSRRMFVRGTLAEVRTPDAASTASTGT